MKIKRQFDWEDLLGDQAWTVIELVKKVGMHIMTFRRYIRFAVRAGILIELKKGRYKYYATKSALTRYFTQKEHCHLSLCEECEDKPCIDVLKEKGLYE